MRLPPPNRGERERHLADLVGVPLLTSPRTAVDCHLAVAQCVAERFMSSRLRSHKKSMNLRLRGLTSEQSAP